MDLLQNLIYNEHFEWLLEMINPGILGCEKFSKLFRCAYFSEFCLELCFSGWDWWIPFDGVQLYLPIVAPDSVYDAIEHLTGHPTAPALHAAHFEPVVVVLLIRQHTCTTFNFTFNQLPTTPSTPPPPRNLQLYLQPAPNNPFNPPPPPNADSWNNNDLTKTNNRIENIRYRHIFQTWICSLPVFTTKIKFTELHFRKLPFPGFLFIEEKRPGFLPDGSIFTIDWIEKKSATGVSNWN